jgi:outer membrane protein
LTRTVLLSCFIGVSLCASAHAAEYSLDDLYALALKQSEKIKISSEEVYVSETTMEKAKSVLFPTLTAYGSHTKYDKSIEREGGLITQPENSSAWGLRLNQSMSVSGKEITAFKIAKNIIERTKYDLLAVKEDYMLTVVRAYYDLLRARKLVEITQADVDRLTKYRDAARSRLKVGEATKTAVLRAEAELSGAQSDLIKSRNLLKFARASLARVVGLEGQEFDVKEGPSAGATDGLDDYCTPLTAECLKEKAWTQRAELKSLETQRTIAERTIKFTYGAYWPTLSVEGVYARLSQSPDPGIQPGESTYGGLRLNFPFFEGGLRAAEVNEARARKRQVDYAYQDAKKSIGLEVDGAFLDLITQKGVLSSLEDQLGFANDNYSAVLKQFQNGLASSIDVIDANTLLVTAQRQLAEAVYSYQQAALKVKRATGTLLDSIVGKGLRPQDKAEGLPILAQGETSP